MGEQIRGVSVTTAELYGAADMMGIANLTQIPRPEAVDNDAPKKRGWMVEEFDGSVKLSPEMARVAALCAAPQIFCEFSAHSQGGTMVYQIYKGSDAAVCLLAVDGGFVMDVYDVSALVAFAEGLLPAVGMGNVGDPLNLTQAAAAERFEAADCVARFAIADLAASGAESGAVTARNWVGIECGGAFWLVDDDGVSVTARPLNQEALRAELTGIFALSEKGE